jgi:hypothetical protein
VKTEKIIFGNGADNFKQELRQREHPSVQPQTAQSLILAPAPSTQLPRHPSPWFLVGERMKRQLTKPYSHFRVD